MENQRLDISSRIESMVSILKVNFNKEGLELC